jgi:hypothetical protein
MIACALPVPCCPGYRRVLPAHSAVTVLWRKRHKKFERKSPRLPQRRRPCPEPKSHQNKPSTPWDFCTLSWREAPGEQARGHPATDGHDASRGRGEDAAAGIQRRQHRREAAQQEQPMVQARDAVRSAVDVLRRARAPMTAREIAETLIAGKAPEASRKQSKDLQAPLSLPPCESVTGQW